MPTDAFPADTLTVPWGRIALVLVLTVLATLGAAAAARAYGRGAPRGRRRLLGLLDTLPLGPNRAVYVVEAAGRRFFLAATNEQVTSLGELPGELPGELGPIAATLAPAASPEPARPEPAPLRLIPPTASSLGPSPFDRVLDGIRSFDARGGRRERSA